MKDLIPFHFWLIDEIYENLRKFNENYWFELFSNDQRFPKNNIFAPTGRWFHTIFDSLMKFTKFTKIIDLNCSRTINAFPKIIFLYIEGSDSILRFVDEIYENYWFELFLNDQRFSKNNIFAHWRIWFHNIFDFSTKFTKIYENYCWSRCSRMIYGSPKIILLDPLKDLIVYHLWFLDEIYENYWFELFSNDQRFPKNNTFVSITGSFHIIFDSSTKFTKIYEIYDSFFFFNSSGQIGTMRGRLIHVHQLSRDACLTWTFNLLCGQPIWPATGRKMADDRFQRLTIRGATRGYFSLAFWTS